MGQSLRAGSCDQACKEARRARGSARRRLAALLARHAQDVALHARALPRAWWNGARHAAREARMRPHTAVGYWNGVPYGMDGVSWGLGAGTGLLVPAVGAALVAVEAACLLACPRRHTHVDAWLGKGGREAAGAVVARYGACGRQDIAPSGHLEAGMCLAWLGRHGEALGAYAHADGAGPAGLLPFLRGISLAALNRHREACKEYAGALAMDPGLAMAQAAMEVSRVLPDGCAGDPDGLPLGLCLDTGSGPCAQCGRPAGARGHAPPARGGGQSWRLCHMQGRRRVSYIVAGRAALLGASLVALAVLLLPADGGLAAMAGVARICLQRQFG